MASSVVKRTPNSEINMKKLLVSFAFVLLYIFTNAQKAANDLAENDCNSISAPSAIPQAVNYDFTLNLITNYATNSAAAKYSLPREEDSRISIYSEYGKLVKRNVIKKEKPGQHSFDFDLKEIAAGVYYLWLTAHNDNLILKFTVPN